MKTVLGILLITLVACISFAFGNELDNPSYMQHSIEKIQSYETSISVLTYYLFGATCSLINEWVPWTTKFFETFSIITSIFCIIVVNIVGEDYPINRIITRKLSISMPSVRVAGPSQVSLSWILMIALVQCGSYATKTTIKRMYSNSAFLLQASDLWYYFFIVICNLPTMNSFELLVPVIATAIFYQEQWAGKTFNRYALFLILLNVICDMLFKVLFKRFKKTQKLSFLEGMFYLCITDLLKGALYYKSIIQEIRSFPSVLKDRPILPWIMQAFLFYHVCIYFRKTAMLWFDQRVNSQSSCLIMLYRDLAYKLLQAWFPATSTRTPTPHAQMCTNQFLVLKVLNGILLVFGRTFSAPVDTTNLQGNQTNTPFSAFEIKRSFRIFLPLVPPVLYDHTLSNHSSAPLSESEASTSLPAIASIGAAVKQPLSLAAEISPIASATSSASMALDFSCIGFCGAILCSLVSLGIVLL